MPLEIETPPVQIRRLLNPTPAETEHIIRILCNAFIGDNFMLAMTSGPPELKPRFFAVQLQTCLNLGELYIACRVNDGTILGTLLLYPPGQDITRPGTNQFYQEADDYVAGLPSRTQHWWKEELRKRYDYLMQKTFSGSETRRDLCFMKYIAVDPPYQKKGIGRLLLEFVFRRSRTTRTATYTETFNNAATASFMRNGFEYVAVANFMSREGGFPIFTLRRRHDP